MNDTPPAAADATVDTLLTAYLRALDETHDVPAFSPWRYAALFGDLVRWEVAFLALVFVAPLLKLIRLCLRRFGADVPRGTPSLGWQEVKRPFQAIWRGDISALQVVRMRVLTRTFIGSHIVGVVEELKLVAERARLDALMGGPARADDLGPLETELRKLESLGTVAKAQNSLGAVLATGSASALPLAMAKLLIPAILQLLPGDVADQIGAFVPLGQVLKTIGLADDETISLTPVLLAIGGGFLTFLLITVMSCHMEKRRILAAVGAYDLEDALLRSRRIATFELPLDVAFAAGAAAAGFLTVYFYSSLTLAEPDRSDQMQTAIANLVLCLGIAIIVAARRWYLRRPPGARSAGLVWSLVRPGLLRAIGRGP
jgi:hypothetical protein